jgi:hypothetical protein
MRIVSSGHDDYIHGEGEYDVHKRAAERYHDASDGRCPEVRTALAGELVESLLYRLAIGILALHPAIAAYGQRG